MSDKPKPDLAIAAAERSLADRIEAEWYASPRPSPHPKLCTVTVVMGQSVANGCYSSSGWRVPDFALEGAVQDLETPIEEVIQLAEDRAYGEPGAMDVFFDQNGNLL